MEDNDKNEGGVKIHVPDKEISQIVLRNLEEYDEANHIANTGIPRDPSITPPRDRNVRVENRFAGLRRMRALQAAIITSHIRATISKNCYNSWKRKYRTEEERIQNPFDSDDNDINDLRDILIILKDYEQQIEKSELTPSKDDDFIWEKEDQNGETRKELSPNFYKMYDELVEHYTRIYGCLIDHRIVTLGVTEDLDKTEREKELEAMRRITNA